MALAVIGHLNGVYDRIGRDRNRRPVCVIVSASDAPHPDMLIGFSGGVMLAVVFLI